MASQQQKIYHIWKKWANDFYFDESLYEEKERDPYRAVVESTEGPPDSRELKEIKEFAYIVFMSLEEKMKDEIASTPFFLLKNTVESRMSITDSTTRSQIVYFLDECWDHYIKRIDTPKSASMLNKLDSNPRGADLYIESIPISMLFRCSLFLCGGMLKNSTLNRMGIFSDKLIELSVVHSHEKKQAEERLRKKNELLKQREVLSSRYLVKCASEYERYMKTYDKNVNVAVKMKSIQSILNAIHKAEQCVTEDAILSSVREDLDNHLNLVNVSHASSLLNRYKDVTKNEFIHIVAQVTFICDNAKSLSEMRAMIELNDILKQCKNARQPILSSLLISSYRSEVERDVTKLCMDKVKSSLSDAYQALCHAADHMDPALFEIEDCVKLKSVMVKAPTYPTFSQSSNEEEQIAKRKRADSPILNALDQVLEEAAKMDAYRVGHLLCQEIRNFPSLSQVQQLIQNIKPWYSETNKNLFVSTLMGDVLKSLQVIDARKIYSQDQISSYIKSYAKNINVLRQIADSIQSDISSEFISYNAIVFEKEDELFQLKPDEIHVPAFKLNKLVQNLSVYINVIKALPDSVKSADKKKLTFVNSLISVNSIGGRPVNFSDTWKFVFSLIIISVKNSL